MGLTVVESTGGPWLKAAAALDAGRSLGDACASAGLDRRTIARLVSPGAGAWVELLDGVEGARVLIAEHSPGLAGLRVAGEAAVVAFADMDETRAHFRRRWLGDQAADVMVDTEQRLTTDRGPWDLVVLDGVLPVSRRGHTPPIDARVRRLAAGLAPYGRLVVVADNRPSPLRAVDRTIGRPAGPPGPSLRAIERAVADAGMAVVQRFGLLRSSLDGVTAFDLDAPLAASAVLASAIVNMDHTRAMGLRLLRLLAQHRAAAPIVPAWMVVGSFSSSRWASSPSRPTGRLGHKRSEEVKLLRGEPPTELEKRYPTPDAAGGEAMALRELEARGLNVAPRLLAQRGPDRLRQAWHPGRPLRPAGLRPDELRAWVARAAQTIRTIQRATERSDGTVLVHGDYWLGNLLVEAGRVVAVLDWTRAHWGEPTEDVRHLVDHLVEMGWASAQE
ncbi:MAG: aminoglycoside phosphotransferase family protein, partial [Actinomycetota bacterium]|nr:aminoglycoside phosphotransferase family protein [Actinomycetota bacterium]